MGRGGEGMRAGRHIAKTRGRERCSLRGGGEGGKGKGFGDAGRGGERTRKVEAFGGDSCDRTTNNIPGIFNQVPGTA